MNPEAPALNPTGGVTVKQPLGGLVFRKDPTRPGGGVFIARDTTNEAVDKHLPQGTIINERSAEGEALASSYDYQRPNAMAWTLEGTSSQQHQQQQQHHSHPQHPQQQQGQSIVNYAPLGANFPNVNPAMNTQGVGQQQHMAIPPGHVQVLNLLDQPQGGNALEQLAIADAGFLEGMPSTIFDWGQ